MNSRLWRFQGQAASALLLLVACAAPQPAAMEPVPPGVERHYQDDPPYALRMVRETLEGSGWRVLEVQKFGDAHWLMRATPSQPLPPNVVGVMPRVLRVRVEGALPGGTVVEVLAGRPFAERMFRQLDLKLRRTQ